MAIDVRPKRAPATTTPAATPLAIEVRDLKKAFRLPGQKVDSLKERALHPRAQREVSVLTALDGISFEVHQGEFFGIVGRNGSGKSTLLKILASIYRADAGRVRMAGRLAPFIELGVGFNMELTARENVILNGVMMGLSRREAAKRLDGVIEFAELEDFVDLKLKNYSSGMLVRLGFSVMIQADTDILLIDEVLAVGDASFQQKCADVFHQMRGTDKTLVLVTHDMGSVNEYCDRAMLLHDGEIVHQGDPNEVGRHYLRLNFGESAAADPTEVAESETGSGVTVVDVWLEDARGERAANLEIGEDIRLHAVLEANVEVPRPTFAFLLSNADGVQVFGDGTKLRVGGDGDDVLRPGERVEMEARVENTLGTGRYFIDVGVNREHSQVDNVIWISKALDFVIFGTDKHTGLVNLSDRLVARKDPR